MNAKHTLGPWGEVTEEFGHCERGIEYPDDRDHYLAIVQCGDPNELEANARLIAAAPELLAALQEFERFAEPMITSSYGREVVNRVRAAIAKATGGAL